MQCVHTILGSLGWEHERRAIHLRDALRSACTASGYRGLNSAWQETSLRSLIFIISFYYFRFACYGGFRYMGLDMCTALLLLRHLMLLTISECSQYGTAQAYVKNENKKTDP
jgi:hypothetical protein